MIDKIPSGQVELKIDTTSMRRIPGPLLRDVRNLAMCWQSASSRPLTLILLVHVKRSHLPSLSSILLMETCTGIVNKFTSEVG